MPGEIGASIFSPRPAPGIPLPFTPGRDHCLPLSGIVGRQQFESNSRSKTADLTAYLNALLGKKFNPRRSRKAYRRIRMVTVSGNYPPLIVAKCCKSVSVFTAAFPARDDHEIATATSGHAHAACGTPRPGGRSLTSKKHTGRRPHAEQGSDRSDSASEKRRQGNPGRGRHGRERQGGDLPGRVRQARPGQGRSDDRRQRVLDRLDDQGGHDRGRDATGRAGQALARRADRQAVARSRLAAGAGRFRRQGRAEAAAGEGRRSRCAIS